VPRLRRADCSGPGITRRRRGKGFEYLDEDGERIADEEVLARIRELAIPPAWKDVWICPYPMGHLQATGTDAAGRKQYLYHPRWRERRDQKKFDDMVEFARSLPRMRERVTAHLAREEMDRERVLACAARLLDRGFFRIGSEDYADENGTYGLATMRKQHVTLGDDGDGMLTFDYPAKGGLRQVQAVVDPDVYEVVATLKRRRGGKEELLAWREGRAWRDVRSEDINDYLREVTEHECSAKDFRTWNATVLAAVALSVSAPAATGSKTGRKRAITRAIKEVAGYLGNTPAVCRASYIDPRVFDRFRSGWTIAGVLPEIGDLSDPDVRLAVEAAVLDLLEDERASDALEKGLAEAA
jgi:DNA topoisomerase I